VKVSRRRTALVTAVAALLLSSCGSTGSPGVAAEVAGERITDEQVDEFARVLCRVGAAQGSGQTTPTSTVRHNAVQLLLFIETAAQVGDFDDLDRADVDMAMGNVEEARELLPEELVDTFDEVIVEFAQAQAALIARGRESLVEQGQDPAGIDPNTAYAEGERLQQEFLRSADIEIDPRFGSIVDGQLRAASGSLSVPVSDIAVGSASQEPSEGFADLLPAALTCG
jgi:hypothetical protein